MELKVGTRLRSAACETEVIVVRAGGDDIDLRCGGHPMVPATDAAPGGSTIDEAFAAGSALGKRYGDEALHLEVLVTKAGAGSLSVGRAALAVKDPKRLPSSD